MLGKDNYFYLYHQRIKNELGDTKFHSQIILLDQAPIQSIFAIIEVMAHFIDLYNNEISSYIFRKLCK